MEVNLGTRRISAERSVPPEAEFAAMHDEAAERWHDRVALLGYSRAYEDLFESLLADSALISLREGGRVLDCGIGTGAFSLALAGKVAAPVTFEGVDISLRMLLRASLDLDRARIEARLHLRNVKALPFEDDAFEAVIGAHVPERLLDPFAAHSEMVRVLEPGGPLVIVVISRSMPDTSLRVKWCPERVELEGLVFGMEEVGLTGVRAYPLLVGGPLPRRTSFAYVAFKREGSQDLVCESLAFCHTHARCAQRGDGALPPDGDARQAELRPGALVEGDEC